MPHRCRIQKQRFVCGHRGLGHYCHRCQPWRTKRVAEQKPIAEQKPKRAAGQKRQQERQLDGAGDMVDLSRLPKPIQIKARRVLGALQEGVPYWKLGGKRLKALEGAVRIPITYRYRLLGRLEAGRVVPVRVLSHEDYNPLVRSQRRLKQVLGG